MCEIFVFAKRLIGKLIGLFGLVAIKKKTLDSFSPRIPLTQGLIFLLSLQSTHVKDIYPILSKCRSQNYQDLFVLSEFGLKKQGFFVEFGASNGLDFSNSFLLENDFGWSGILVEPARIWHEALRRNRPKAIIEESCVWRISDSLMIFNQTIDGNLSTLDAFSSSDSHRELRQSGNKYEVRTISLTDLLDKYSAPKTIDYLSIDTEGSEFEILNAFDFDRYSFSMITCEHNYTPARDKIHKLLTSKGYVRKYEELSLWDDWYVKV